MKYLLGLSLSLLLIMASGCEQLKGLLQETEYAKGAYAEVTIYGNGGVIYKYRCAMDPDKAALFDCKKVSEEKAI